MRYSPGVPAGAVGGGTWSNQPSFSSYMRNRAVFAQTAWLASSAFRTSETKYWPWFGDADGWSSKPRGGMIHDTLGSAPLATSAAKVPGKVGVNALAYSAEAAAQTPAQPSLSMTACHAWPKS